MCTSVGPANSIIPLSVKEQALSHLARVSATLPDALSAREKNGSLEVFDPQCGTAYLFLKSGAAESFIGKALSDIDLYLRTDALNQIVGNSRAARLAEVAFNGKWHAKRFLKAFVYVKDASDVEICFPTGIDISPYTGAAYDFALNCLRFLASEDGLSLSPEEAEAYTAALQNSPDVFCLYKDGNPVSMGRILDRADVTSRIGWIVTLPSYRGNGYAALMAAFLAQQELEKGLIPVLYTCSDNEAAIRCYRKAGFSEAGNLTELSV